MDGLQPASARGLVRAAEQWADAGCLTDLRIPAGGERGLQGGACGGIRAWAAGAAVQLERLQGGACGGIRAWAAGAAVQLENVGSCRVQTCGSADCGSGVRVLGVGCAYGEPRGQTCSSGWTSLLWLSETPGGCRHENEQRGRRRGFCSSLSARNQATEVRVQLPPCLPPSLPPSLPLSLCAVA